MSNVFLADPNILDAEGKKMVESAAVIVEKILK